MTLAIIAGIAFLAHVAVWLGLPASPPDPAPADTMVLETA